MQLLDSWDLNFWTGLRRVACLDFSRCESLVCSFLVVVLSCHLMPLLIPSPPLAKSLLPPPAPCLTPCPAHSPMSQQQKPQWEPSRLDSAPSAAHFHAKPASPCQVLACLFLSLPACLYPMESQQHTGGKAVEDGWRMRWDKCAPRRIDEIVR